jgi:hypothetical protein
VFSAYEKKRYAYPHNETACAEGANLDVIGDSDFAMEGEEVYTVGLPVALSTGGKDVPKDNKTHSTVENTISNISYPPDVGFRAEDDGVAVVHHLSMHLGQGK